MGWETCEECPQEWGHGSLKGRTGGEEKSPSFARIDRLKPAPPNAGFRREAKKQGGLFHAGQDLLDGGSDSGILGRGGRGFVREGRKDQAARIDPFG